MKWPGILEKMHNDLSSDLSPAPMLYRALVNSDRSEDLTADSLQKACELAAMLSEDFGWVDVRRNVCGPEPILATYNNGRAV